MEPVIVAHIPHISISPAPPPEPVIEPYSPFHTVAFAPDNDTFRPTHLTPPPTGPQRFSVNQPSPLRPVESRENKGLDLSRFQALLRASKDRNSSSKKENDLRKEIALKAHKNKQLERRAMFLSKVMAPPSPTATSTPKTPPDSPALFHYRLPSPGLISPLSLFDSLNDDCLREPIEPIMWVEQVDFKLSAGLLQPKAPPSEQSLPPVNPLPSLDQISARMRFQKRYSVQIPSITITSAPAATTERPRLTLGVGRLRMPLRTSKQGKPENLCIFPPASPHSPFTPNLEVTTQFVPRSTTTSPTQLSESNLMALNSRTRRASDMMSTLRRRLVPSEQGHTGHDPEVVFPRHRKRHSAPAELVSSSRVGFQHPVLSLAGGF